MIHRQNVCAAVGVLVVEAARLRDTCVEHNVQVLESVMSLSGMVNVGKGALVVGFAAEPHKFE